MGDGALRLTLREWRGHFLNPIGLIVQACVGAVLGVSGPFGTQDTVAFLPRILYWIWVVYSTYGIGLFGLTYIQTLMKDRPIWVQSLVSGCLNGLAISLYIVSLNLLIFGPSSMPYGPSSFLFRVFLIGFFVTAAGAAIASIVYSRQKEASPNPKDLQPPVVPLMERLPLDKRGELVALSVEDHYVRVKTTAGVEMILMRLSDAIRETGETWGDQVHRSHWVSYAQVASARREGDRAILTMKDGADVPVSRANLPKIREARLLPR
ncbi:MAG: LytTR family transcriptional regulator [Cognatishimia sp.]|nr:LytTR family transcriptional regulator [Cognatishimia sp.]